MASKKSPKKAPKKPVNPWNAHGFAGDGAPFKGAGPPIHSRDGGKYHPSNRKKKAK